MRVHSSTLCRALSRSSVLWLAFLALAPRAEARSNGLVSPACSCHSLGQAPEVKLIASNAFPALGETIDIRIIIQAINGGVGGMYFEQADGDGVLSAGPGTRQEQPKQIVHSAPMPATSGEVHFDLKWTAPSTAGVAYFKVYGVSANGNGSITGDGEGRAALGVAVGCDPAAMKTYFYDADKDGVGDSARGSRPSCTEILGWAAADGDCDENRNDRYPGAPERCNERDDDCDGTTDEGVQALQVYPDADGDGYGDADGIPATGCSHRNYVPDNTDCDDGDPARHPRAEEVCNAFDDDCDFRTDERVTPTCGTGGCARRSPTCDPQLCVPAAAEPEVCDFLDNDCDSALDEGLTCDRARPLSGTGAGGAIGPAPIATQVMPSPIAPPTDGSTPTRTNNAGAETSGCNAAGTVPGHWLWLAFLAGIRRRRARVQR